MLCALYHDNLSSSISHILNGVSPLYIQSSCLLFIAVGMKLLTVSAVQPAAASEIFHRTGRLYQQTTDGRQAVIESK